MKIGVNIRLLQVENITGIQSYIINLYNEVLKKDLKNDYIFLPAKNPIGRIGNQSKIYLKNLISNILFDNHKITKLIEKESIDIYHSPSIVLPYKKIKNKKYVVTIHDLAFKKYRNIGPWYFNQYFDIALKNACDKADAIIAVSKSAKNDIIEYFREAEEKTHVIYSGVDKYYAYRVSDSFKESLYGKYNLERDRLNILVNATHNHRKNIGLFLDIFINTAEIYKNCNLIITGNIENQSIIFKIKNSKINNIYMLGYLSKEELRGIFQICEIFVYPSLYEGFGLPILEATVSGCLVLASNTSSIPEIIKNKNLLFDPFDKSEIRDKLLWAIELGDEHRKKIVNQNQKDMKRFNWENTAEEMLKIYQRVL